jgi:hypothetical protein
MYDIEELKKAVQVDYDCISKYKHVHMRNYSRIWEDPDMWKSIKIAPRITQKVANINKNWGGRIVGIHIRRTDHPLINENPIVLFINKIQEEIDLYGNGVRFYLASDSLDVKKEITAIFGNKIITCMHETSRNNKEGIIDAFVEMNVLSATDKIYASCRSSFSETAHLLSNNEFEELSMSELIK